MKLQTIILAAGQGSRMCSDTPKVLHRLGNQSLLQHVCSKAQALKSAEIYVVIGHGAALVRQHIEKLEIECVEQTHQLGTGHAVLQVIDKIQDEAIVLVLYGDVPLLDVHTLEALVSLADRGSLALLSVLLKEPTGYGRIVRNKNDQVQAIVEEKDASNDQRKIKEVNTGILAVRGHSIKNWLKQLNNENAQGEFYLTDIISFAVHEGHPVTCLQAEKSETVAGINNRLQLAEAERVYQRQLAESLMIRGVTLRDPARFDLRGSIRALGKDIEMDINVVLEGDISLGNRVRIGPNVCLKNVTIADDVEIYANSVLEGVSVATGCKIGPMARLRPGTSLGESVHIGNFVEIKQTRVERGSKINHLSYIGDSEVGASVNIGAGTITCNYDGVNKHKTIIEDGAFIGSDSQLVAPVRVGRNATIGAGSTITRDAPDDQLTLSRTRQVSIASWKRPVKIDADRN